MKHRNTHPTTAVITVTPAIAEQWLGKNTSNRTLRNHVVTALAGAMKRGEWKLTHQGIAFDRSGVLQDGQHRLWAVVESGVTVDMMVTRNADPDAFVVLDVGAKRTIADALSLPKAHAEIATTLARLHTSNNSLVNAQLVAKYHSAFKPWIDTLLSYHAGSTRRFSAASIKAMAVLQIATNRSALPYAGELYANLCTTRVEKLPAVGAAFFRAALDERMTTANLVDTACRSWKLFDPKHKDDQRILIKDHDNTMAEIKAAIGQVINYAKD